jgi:predicted KAP-like P-loop ATPase
LARDSCDQYRVAGGRSLFAGAMILSDNETKVDLLNNDAIAKTVVMLLRERPEHPVTIGVHGDWGVGKSSVLEMIESELDEQKDTLCLKFKGWRFQRFEDAKIALIEGIVTGLIEKSPVHQDRRGTATG